MNQKKNFGFLFIDFCFFLFCIFLSLTTLLLAQNSSVLEGITDTQWLKFMDKSAFKLEGLRYKMPLLASELNLNVDELQEVKNLFSDHGDEKLLSQMATSPGIRGTSRDASLNASESKDKNANYIAMEDNADDAPTETLNQVKLVRKILGSRDLDFRFWFYEEVLIDTAEDRAYHANHYYSPDQLTANLLNAIEQSQEFKDFKTRKMALIQDDQKEETYFSNWRTWIEKRVLLQIHQVKHRV